MKAALTFLAVLALALGLALGLTISRTHEWKQQATISSGRNVQLKDQLRDRDSRLRQLQGKLNTTQESLRNATAILDDLRSRTNLVYSANATIDVDCVAVDREESRRQLSSVRFATLLQIRLRDGNVVRFTNTSLSPPIYQETHQGYRLRFAYEPEAMSTIFATRLDYLATGTALLLDVSRMIGVVGLRVAEPGRLARFSLLVNDIPVVVVENLEPASGDLASGETIFNVAAEFATLEKRYAAELQQKAARPASAASTPVETQRVSPDLSPPNTPPARARNRVEPDRTVLPERVSGEQSAESIEPQRPDRNDSTELNASKPLRGHRVEILYHRSRSLEVRRLSYVLQTLGARVDFTRPSDATGFADTGIYAPTRLRSAAELISRTAQGEALSLPVRTSNAVGATIKVVLGE